MIRLVDGRPMQCKDIPDQLFIDAVRRTPAPFGNMRPGAWRMRWDVQHELEKTTGPIPEKLFLAKASKLFARKILGGCSCGCRGDYHLIEDCEHPDQCCL